MKKFRLYLDEEKEVKWLNEMCDQGWKLVSFFAGVYTFEECEKGKYLYQEDTTNTFFRVSDDYREFMKEASVEIVQVWGPWVILCSERSKGKFELFTDNESKIEHQKKILKIFKAVSILELICFFTEIFLVMEGSHSASYAAIIVGVILFAFCRMIFITKARINRLRADNGEIAINGKGVGIDADTGKTKRIYSPVLMLGNGLYLIALCMNYEGSALRESIHLTVLILSCILMLAGVWLTCYGTKEN